MRGFFITGTDTGAGKTYFASALAYWWRKQKRSIHVCKPVATGAIRQNDQWVCEDATLLAQAAGETDVQAIAPWMFPEPAAPSVASRLAGVKLRISSLAEAVFKRKSGVEAVLVEGVGGLLCPLTEKETVADLAAVLGLPLIVVARRSLGTLNHTLLTLEIARHRSLNVVGVVVTETKPAHGLAEETNVEELKRHLNVPLLAVLPYQPDPKLACDALSIIDWWALAG
jgi:dethiobiotin synthetase